jgi:Glycerophosphoryl diester phosphodiesterase
MKFIIIIFIIIILYLLAICPRLLKRKTVSQFCQKNYAHRGLFSNSKGIPENSLPAFQNAVRAGYGIELDVQITKDNKVVVFHDDTLSRMCQIDSRVCEKTYEELQELSLLQTKYKIPLLSDILSLVDGKIPLLIEIKLTTACLDTCVLVNEVLLNYHGDYCIESFNSLVLLWYRRHRPDIIRGQLSANLTKPIADGGLILSFIIKHLLSNFLSAPDFIAYAYNHTSNISFWINKYIYKVPIFAWTIRSEAVYNKVINSFDSFIFENFFI